MQPPKNIKHPLRLLENLPKLAELAFATLQLPEGSEQKMKRKRQLNTVWTCMFPGQFGKERNIFNVLKSQA